MSLVVKNLKKSYGNKVVVDNLSFELPKPGVYALLGTNGAGKTTAIRMILGMLAKDGGEVLWNGQPLTTDSCNIGYLAEERGLYPKYSLMDQLIYFAGLRGVPKAEAKERIKYWAHRLEAEEYLYAPVAQLKGSQSAGDEAGAAQVEAAPVLGEKKKVKLGRTARAGGKKKAFKPKLADQLSKGNQQKIQFMIALISDPELIVLDEPLSGLDPVNTDLFKSIIREQIEAGKYLIMSSHQMATVEEFCTEITILDRSKPVLQGNLNEIKKSYGRVNLHLKTEQDVRAAIEEVGAVILTEKENEYQIKVTGDKQANELLAKLIAAGVTVVTFDLREPSLHEIFVEKVGEVHE